MAKKTKPWKPSMPYLRMRAETERIVLRAYRHSDFPVWQAAYKARKKKKNRFDESKPASKYLTHAAFLKVLARHRRVARKRGQFIFGIFDRDSGSHIGAIDFFLFNTQLRWANLGYQVHNQLAGSGYASEAAKLALRIGFGPLKLHRIEASCEPAHLASARVAVKAGLEPEGRRKKFFPEKGGIDIIVFGMNAIDYKAKATKRKP